MAAIEVAPLGDRFGEDEIAALASALQGVGAPVLPNADESAAKTIADGVDGELVADFLDRLEAFDMACDVYVPVEFESRVEVGELRVGSSQCLIDVLDEMKDDLDVEEEEETGGGEDGEGDFDVIRAQMRQLWKLMYAGAHTSVERKLPLHLRT
ncbi:MAG: hypothetical protein AABZ30_12445 [Myxococcota bacterium]